MILSLFFSDAMILWCMVNVFICWPLAYEIKKKEITTLVTMINAKLDQVIVKLPFMSKASQSEEASRAKKND